MELYYYTSTDTMRYILEKGDIYATNIRYMNDSEEYTNGLIALHKLANNEEVLNHWRQKHVRKDISVDDIKKVFTDENLQKNKQDMEYYSISFCETNDLLSQWAIYAKESGVSIKMDFKKKFYSFEAESTEERGDIEEKEGTKKKERARWQLLPQRVFYFTYDPAQSCETEYQKTAYEVLDRLFDSRDPLEGKNENWKYVSTLIKRYDFYQEAEQRLVFRPDLPPFPPRIQYRMDKKVLKPYIDLECENGWPVTGIMVGPGFNQQVVYDSVVHFLEHTRVKNGIENTDEYVERIRNYFRPYHEKLNSCELYQRLDEYCSDKDIVSHMSLEDAQCIFAKQVKDICGEVCDSKEYDSELKAYIAANHFASCGTVVSKSSIPYIF